MKKNQNGFSVLTIFILILVIGVVACVASYVIIQNRNSTTNPIENKKTTNISGAKTIILIDKTSKRPIKNTDMKVVSNNPSAECTESRCGNPKYWQSKTDNNGSVAIPVEYIQKITSITAHGYLEANIDDTDKSTQKLEIAPSSH